MSERSEQEAIFEWAAIKTAEIPELNLLFAIPNGQYRRGQRPEPGMQAGVPDMFLPFATYFYLRGRQEYYGLFIELKVGRNKVTVMQDRWLSALRAQGYYTAVCYGFDEAVACIEWYLGHREGEDWKEPKT